MRESRKLPHKTFSAEMGEYMVDANAKQIDEYSAHVVTQGNEDTVASFFATLTNLLVENAIVRHFMTDDTPEQVLELYSESANAAANFFELKLNPGKQLRYEWRNQSCEIAVPEKISGHTEYSILWQGITSALIAGNLDKLKFLVRVPLDTRNAGIGPFDLRVMVLQSLCRGDEKSQAELINTLRGLEPTRNLDSKSVHSKDQMMLALCENDPAEISDAVTKCLSAHARFYDSNGRNMRFNVHGLIASDVLAMLVLARIRRIRFGTDIKDGYIPRELLDASQSRIDMLSANLNFD